MLKAFPVVVYKAMLLLETTRKSSFT